MEFGSEVLPEVHIWKITFVLPYPILEISLILIFMTKNYSQPNILINTALLLYYKTLFQKYVTSQKE